MELMDADLHHYCKNEFLTECLSEVKLKVILKQEMKEEKWIFQVKNSNNESK